MLNVIRVIFVAVGGILGLWLSRHAPEVEPWQGIVAGMGGALSLVLLEMAFARRVAGVVGTIGFALICGFIVAHFLVAGLNLIPVVRELETQDQLLLQTSTLVVCTFLTVLITLHVRDDFKFVIPFIEFSREGRFGRPILADTSAIIDGRLAELLESKVIDSPLVVPRFVLKELHALADSADKIKRGKGRRGLDILERMRTSRRIDVRIHDATVPGEATDHMVIQLAKMIDARVITTDSGLEKVGEVQGVEVVNLHEVANSMRPPYLQGDRVPVRIVKPGDNEGQGVGYLPDGTMVVAEECGNRIGQEVELTVTNIMQTNVGRLVFGRPTGAPARR